MPNTDVQRLPYSLLRGAMQSRAGNQVVNTLARLARFQKFAGHSNDTVEIPRADDTGTIRTKVYRPLDVDGPLPIAVYYHGGGYVTGLPEGAHFRMGLMRQARPCVIVAPDYRLTLEAPYPAGHDDCYDALVWAAQNADQIGGRADQIVLVGDSAGGGLVLATALRARDLGAVSVAAQVPIYPMIDDRSENWTPMDQSLALWTDTANQLAWDLLLSDLLQRGRDIPAYAAPARATDVSGLPPTLSFIGDQDIFLNENAAMFDRMRAAGVPVSTRVFENTWHAMEVLNPRSRPSKAINAWFVNEFGKLLDDLD